MGQGNTYDLTVKKWGHARKVWREVKSQYPSGGTIENVADWASAGIIPAGTPAKFDMATKKVTAYTQAQITDGDVASLGINGYTKEDVVISGENAICSATVVYAGEIYEYMFEEAVASALKQVTTTPQIVWVR